MARAGHLRYEPGFGLGPARRGLGRRRSSAPRQTAWPGEDQAGPVEDTVIANRDQDFVQFVLDDVAARRQAEDDFYAGLDPASGELQ